MGDRNNYVLMDYYFNGQHDLDYFLLFGERMRTIRNVINDIQGAAACLVTPESIYPLASLAFSVRIEDNQSPERAVGLPFKEAVDLFIDAVGVPNFIREGSCYELMERVLECQSPMMTLERRVGNSRFGKHVVVSR